MFQSASMRDGSSPTTSSEASLMTPAMSLFATLPGYVVISPQPVIPASVSTWTNT